MLFELVVGIHPIISVAVEGYLPSPYIRADVILLSPLATRTSFYVVRSRTSCSFRKDCGQPASLAGLGAMRRLSLTTLSRRNRCSDWRFCRATWSLLLLIVAFDNLLHHVHTLFLARRRPDVVQRVWCLNKDCVVDDNLVVGPSCWESVRLVSTNNRHACIVMM